MSSDGSIAVGTDKGVLLSVGDSHGNAWQMINDQLGTFDVKSLIFDSNGRLFFSGIYNSNPTIYLFDLNSGGFTQIIDGIVEKPLVKDFTLDETGIVSAAVDSSVYQFISNQHIWSSLAISDQKTINKIRFTKIGDLLSFDDYSLKIFDREKKTWYPNHPDLKFDQPIVDAVITEKYAWVTLPNNIYKIKNDGIIQLVLSKHFLLLDDKGNLFINKTFSLFRASCDNNQDFLKDITTNNNGSFNLNYDQYNLKQGDQIKLEKLIHTRFAIKTGHEAFGNKLEDIYLNNMKFDGAGNPNYYSLTDNSTQTIFIDHTMIHCFLVVSVQWEAKREYLDSLSSWCKYMSEFLYDVTDGQLFVEGISINDNFEKWNQADIRIFASNMVWPCANVDGIHSSDDKHHCVNFPRRFFGNSDADRNNNNRSNWFITDEAMNSLFESSTIGHELGHYMFGFYDEYVWTNTEKQKLVPAGYNFGFMKSQYMTASDWSSEMSDQFRYSNPDFRYTAQWTNNGSDCWTQFKNKYEGYYSDVNGSANWLPIKRPSERTLDVSMKYMKGPMDFMSKQNQCSIRNLVQVKINDKNYGSGDYVFKVLNEFGQPAAKSDVDVFAPLGQIYLFKENQGQSADDGSMIVVGVSVNDKITISHTVRMWNQDLYYYYSEIVNKISGVKNYNDHLQAENVIQLFPIKGEYRMINSMKFDIDGNVNLMMYSEKKFNEIPTVDFQLNNSTLKNYDLQYNNNKSIYNVTCKDSLAEENTLIFNAVDSANKPFSILFNYKISSFGKNVIAPGGAAELFLDTNNTTISKIATVASDYPPLSNGITKNAKQGGSVISISTFPGIILPQTTNILSINYSSSDMLANEEASMSIFKWDETNLIWNFIPSMIDTSMKTVSALVNSGGIYAAFATIVNTGFLDNDKNNYFALDAYPNPVISVSQVQFYLTFPGPARLSLYNTFGQELTTFVDSYLNFGKQSYNIDVRNLESGVYYLRLKVNEIITVKKIVVVK